MNAARSASNTQPSRTLLPRTFRLELQTAANRSASNFSASSPARAAVIGQRTQRGTYSEARRAYSLPLPKVLTRVSARSESADERRPLRLEQSTVSNHPASNAPPRTPNDLKPSALIFRTVSTPGTPYPAAPALSPRRG